MRRRLRRTWLRFRRWTWELMELAGMLLLMVGGGFLLIGAIFGLALLRALPLIIVLVTAAWLFHWGMS